MLDESQLRREFSYGGFNSYYSSRCVSEVKQFPFYGGDKEFDTIISYIREIPNERYCYPCFGRFQSAARDLLIRETPRGDNEKLRHAETLYIVINTNIQAANKYCQYCWMTVEELINHINIVKSLFDGFEFSVLKDEKNNFMKVKFLFKEDITLFNIRFLLTWMRYSYEWAISMATMDAYRIFKHPEYMPELAKENIFNLVEITNKLTYLHVLPDQVICATGIPMELELLKSRISQCERYNCRLNSIYDSVKCPKMEFRHLSSDTSDTNRLNIPLKTYTSLSWWEDEESFVKDRLPIYKEILQTLIEKYKYEPAR